MYETEFANERRRFSDEAITYRKKSSSDHQQHTHPHDHDNSSSSSAGLQKCKPIQAAEAACVSHRLLQQLVSESGATAWPVDWGLKEGRGKLGASVFALHWRPYNKTQLIKTRWRSRLVATGARASVV